MHRINKKDIIQITDGKSIPVGKSNPLMEIKILKNKKEIGTTLGATNLFNINKKNKLQTVTISKYQNKSLKSLYQLWEKNLYRKELFSHSK